LNHLKITLKIPEQHTGKHEIKKLHNADILDTAHVPRKVQMYKYRTYFTCEMALHVAQIVSTEQLQPYIPYKYSLFVVIIINTLNNKYTINSVTLKID
jgi:hypothetical protein